MKKEAMRLAVAKAVGWTDCQFMAEPYRHFGNVLLHGHRLDNPNVWSVVPDYTNDLNACHEVERVLMLRQQPVYISHLVEITDSKEFGLIHATADQRCEAFLKTIGLWAEEKEL